MKLNERSAGHLPIRASNSVILRMYRHRFLLLLFLPTFLYFIVFKYFPMFGIIASFKDYQIFKGLWASPWVGFKYFELFFNNPSFFKLIKNTFLLSFYTLIFGFPAPIILALILNEVKHKAIKKMVQSISYIPHFLSTVIVVSMVTLFLSPTNGLINDLFGLLFGWEPINFMGDPHYFRFIYVLSEIWQTIGWGTIIYIAALAGVDLALYESASMDGANRWHKLRYITLPGIFPTAVIMFILSTGGLLNVGFEKVFLLYNPAVYSTADVLSTYIYRVGLKGANFSYGTAIDVFTSIVGFVFVYASNYLSRRVGETSLW